MKRKLNLNHAVYQKNDSLSMRNAHCSAVAEFLDQFSRQEDVKFNKEIVAQFVNETNAGL